MAQSPLRPVRRFSGCGGVDRRRRQNSAFVAIKVMMSKYSGTASMVLELEISSTFARTQEERSGSDHVLRLLDFFEERGPNGTHMCLVYPPMGGKVASMVEKLVASQEPLVPCNPKTGRVFFHNTHMKEPTAPS